MLPVNSLIYDNTNVLCKFELPCCISVMIALSEVIDGRRPTGLIKVTLKIQGSLSLPDPEMNESTTTSISENDSSSLFSTVIKMSASETFAKLQAIEFVVELPYVRVKLREDLGIDIDWTP